MARKSGATKGGRSMNPADAHRKAQRKRELKKNKKVRDVVREAVIKNKSPFDLSKDGDKLDRQIAAATQADNSGLQLSLKEKKKKNDETLKRVLERLLEVAPSEHAKFIEWAESDERKEAALVSGPGESVHMMEQELANGQQSGFGAESGDEQHSDSEDDGDMDENVGVEVDDNVDSIPLPDSVDASVGSIHDVTGGAGMVGMSRSPACNLYTQLPSGLVAPGPPVGPPPTGGLLTNPFRGPPPAIHGPNGPLRGPPPGPPPGLPAGYLLRPPPQSHIQRPGPPEIHSHRIQGGVGGASSFIARPPPPGLPPHIHMQYLQQQQQQQQQLQLQQAMPQRPVNQDSVVPPRTTSDDKTGDMGEDMKGKTNADESKIGSVNAADGNNLQEVVPEKKSAVISAAPQVRNFKAENIKMIPSSLRIRRQAQAAVKTGVKYGSSTTKVIGAGGLPSTKTTAAAPTRTHTVTVKRSLINPAPSVGQYNPGNKPQQVFAGSYNANTSTATKTNDTDDQYSSFMSEMRGLL
eukprot:CFRG0183T1